MAKLGLSSSIEPPPRVFRDDVVYRTVAHGGVRACGFMLKPGATGGYRDRVLREYIVVYVLRGRGEFTDWHGRRLAVGAGDLIQMPAGKKHSVVQTAGTHWAECYIVADGPFFARVAALGGIDLRRPVLHPGIDLGLIERFEQIHDDLARAPRSAMPRTLAMAHELMCVAHAMDERSASPDPHARRIEAACAALGKDPAQRVDVEALANSLGLSYERFRKIFREQTGLAPNDYQIHRRIDRARSLIAQQRMSAKEVAYALGYPDPFTFSKQFKRVVGLSPEMFRRTV